MPRTTRTVPILHTQSVAVGLSVGVQADADDGYWHSAGGFTTAGNTAFLGKGATNTYRSFYRFQNVTIPAGATITAAYLQLVAGNTGSATTVNLNIYAENADSPAAVTSQADGDGRTKTAAVAWNSVVAWTSGDLIKSPSLVTPIQAVVDRGGWASGNAIQLFVWDNGSSTSAIREPAQRDNLTRAEPFLQIVYTVAGGTTYDGTASATQAQTATTAAQKNTIDVSVTANADDGQWNNSGGFDAGAVNAAIGGSGASAHNAFLRFDPVAIPNNATIDSAYLTVVSEDTQSGTTVNTIISGVDEDDSTAASSAANATGRTLTTANTAWSNIAAWTAGVAYQSPAIATVVEEIVGRPGWASGNAIQIFVKDAGTSTAGQYRRIAMLEHATYAPAALHVEYTPSTGVTHNATASASQAQTAATAATRTQAATSAATQAQVATTVALKVLLATSAATQAQTAQAVATRTQKGTSAATQAQTAQSVATATMRGTATATQAQTAQSIAIRTQKGTSAATQAQVATTVALKVVLATSAATQAQTAQSVAARTQKGTSAATQTQTAQSVATASKPGTSAATQAQTAQSVAIRVQAATSAATQAQTAAAAGVRTQPATATATQAQTATSVATVPGSTAAAATQPQIATTRATLTTNATATATQAQTAATAATRTQRGTATATQAQVATTVGTRTQRATSAATQAQVATTAALKIRFATSSATQAQTAQSVALKVLLATAAATQGQTATSLATRSSSATSAATQAQTATTTATTTKRATASAFQAQIATTIGTFYLPWLTVLQPTNVRLVSDGILHAAVVDNGKLQARLVADGVRAVQVLDTGKWHVEIADDSRRLVEVVS